ncbi:Rv3235 family protein [Kribbella sp. NBC_01505]|uniref:Rv3235 family protein n=1 Tax=Kribbella sp. NBC_01505 TaxID=2903580 RepID=UPI0038676108
MSQMPSSAEYQEVLRRRRLDVVPPIDETRPGLPEARAWGGRLAQAVSEVLAGDRPVAQLVRFTDEEVFVELNRRVRVLGLTTTAGGRGTKERCALRSVRVCRPSSEVAEIAAHVRHGGRHRAIALRMEIRRNRWVCTALEIG